MAIRLNVMELGRFTVLPLRCKDWSRLAILATFASNCFNRYLPQASAGIALPTTIVASRKTLPFAHRKTSINSDFESSDVTFDTANSEVRHGFGIQVKDFTLRQTTRSEARATS